MSMCDNCIHNDVCGLEDNHEEAITFCADMIPKDKYKAEGEQESKWIPVSERLPEESDVYIVTIKLLPELKPYTDFAFYNDNDKQWENGPSNESDMVTDITNEVTAWMLLPEPYKTEEETDGN